VVQHAAAGLAEDERKGSRMMDILEGTLIVLKATHPERDHAYFNAWQQDNQFVRLLDDDAITLWPKKMTKEWLEKHLDDFLSFTIFKKDDAAAPIGFISLDAIEPVSGDCWVGVGIGDRGNWGKGYGTDAMRVMLRYAFCQLNLHRVSLSVFDYNPRAIRSYEKAGFVREGIEPQYLEREGKRYDVILMGILRSEWKDACPEE
jgi:RimJ/RimL family protein N-acetyltransferase